MGKLSAPTKINDKHKTNYFSSGEPALDDWLKRKALKNSMNDASQTFVVCDQDLVVAGYYCLAAGSIERENSPKKMQRNMPSSIPVMVLGRLAVDSSWHGHGIGKGLLKDAVTRSIRISREVGIKALLVHSLSVAATDFYKRFGFIESPIDTMTLMLSFKSSQQK